MAGKLGAPRLVYSVAAPAEFRVRWNAFQGAGISTPKQIPWLRVFVEGVVVVGSILLAFSIDAWWDARNDRVAEVQYLERLLVDVRWDRGENQSVARILDQAVEHSDQLLALVEAGPLSSSDPNLWLELFLRAAAVATPDYSRATYNDLVASGRIELLRSPTVRSALGEYDRTILNYGAWFGFLRGGGRGALFWMSMRWVPDDVVASHRTACPEATHDQGCSIDLGGWDYTGLAVHLGQPETIRDIRESMRVKTVIVGQIRNLLDPSASALEEALLVALGREQ